MSGGARRVQPEAHAPLWGGEKRKRASRVGGRILRPAQAQRGCREERKEGEEEGRTVHSAGIPAFKLRTN